MSKSAARFQARSALDLLEEAVRLLRRAPAPVLLFHAIGSAPCWLYALYFFTDMSRNITAGAHVVGASLTLAAAYIWMKCWQAAAAAHLRAALLQQPAPEWDSQRVWRLVAAQVLLQPLGLVARAWAMVVVIPYVWTATFFQNVTVLGDGSAASLRDLSAQAWAEAKRWPKQAHGIAALLSVFGFFIYTNMTALMVAVPSLMKTLLGIETVFSRHAQGMLNSTFFLAAFALTYLCLDPIRKAAVLLRCFYGGSLESGEDLAVELKRVRHARRGGAPAVAVVLFFLGAFGMPVARAQDAPPRVESTALNRTIDDVLERREFAWRMPRGKDADKGAQELSWLERTQRDVKEWIQAVTWKIGRAIGEFLRKIKEWFFGKPGDSSSRAEGFDWLDSVRVLAWIVIGICAVVLAVLIARRWRRPPAPAVIAEAIATRPDLNADDVTADQLPEDGWLQLARELMQTGELRLALRAAFLAGLAHLGQRELIQLARHKSDRDYDRELRRRARAQAALLAAFGQNLESFERAWYGAHEVTPEVFGAFTENLERIRTA
jgi:hypothetical protein